MQQPVLAPVRVPQLQLDWSAPPHEQRQAVARHNTQVQNVVQAARLETQAAVLGEEAACDDRARLQQRCAELERELGAARALHLQQAGMPGGQLAQGGGIGGGDVMMQEQDQHERELAEVKAACERLREQAAADAAQAQKAGEVALAAAEQASRARAAVLAQQLREVLAAANEMAGIQMGHEDEAACAAAHGQAVQAASQHAAPLASHQADAVAGQAAAGQPHAAVAGEEQSMAAADEEEPALDAAAGGQLTVGFTTSWENAIADFMCLGGNYRKDTVHKLISGTKGAIKASAVKHVRALFLEARLAAPGIAEADCPVIKAPSLTTSKIGVNESFTISRKVVAAGDSQELQQCLAEAIRFFRPAHDVGRVHGPAADSMALHIKFAADPAEPDGPSLEHVLQLVWQGDKVISVEAAAA